MSTLVMGRCWPLQVPPVAKAVLISLADQANDHGVCWPSIATICTRTCYGERAVQNAVKQLQELGLLKVEIGAMKANRYTLLVEQYRRPEPGPDPA
ncbi:MAG: helix-turn-helix domain-containing protein, partial [Rubrivivax sp.]